MNALNSFNKTDGEYSLAPTGDLVRFWRLKFKVAACHRDDEGIHFDTAAVQAL